MNGRSPENQTLHEHLVRLLAKHYSSLGYKGIRADIPGSSETPSGIYWSSTPNQKYVPDIACFKNDAANTLIIAEAETCETLRSAHTQEQWKLFAVYAREKNGEFHIITPESCKDEAQTVTREMGITVTRFWWFNYKV